MTFLPELGQNLRFARKKQFPRDNMKAFSLRVGISRATYQKMEKGDLSVSIKYYYQAAKLLGVEKDFSQLFLLKASLFDD
ncbi:MAG: helix-turn-helix transcriptional regulator [Gammaproteobacteria bacterium]|nr:helix-turn-helix transcriptional regulator [Gammaproteobacteria bacterium]